MTHVERMKKVFTAWELLLPYRMTDSVAAGSAGTINIVPPVGERWLISWSAEIPTTVAGTMAACLLEDQGGIFRWVSVGRDNVNIKGSEGMHVVTNDRRAQGRCYNADTVSHWMNVIYSGLKLRRLEEPLHLHRPAAISAVTTGDIFGLNADHVRAVLDVVERAWLHAFPTLTKLPNRAEALISAGTITIPKNFMFGVTVNRQEDIWRLHVLEEIEAPFKWACFEPLYGPVDYDLSWLDWIVIGPQTRPTLQPEREWVDGILEASGGRVPIYMKSKLDHPEAPYSKEGPRILDITRMIFER